MNARDFSEMLAATKSDVGAATAEHREVLRMFVSILGIDDERDAEAVADALEIENWQGLWDAVKRAHALIDAVS